MARRKVEAQTTNKSIFGESITVKITKHAIRDGGSPAHEGGYIVLEAHVSPESMTEAMIRLNREAMKYQMLTSPEALRAHRDLIRAHETDTVQREALMTLLRIEDEIRKA